VGGLALCAVLLAFAAWRRQAPGGQPATNALRPSFLSARKIPRISPKAFGVLVLPIAGDDGNALGLELIQRLGEMRGVEARIVAEAAPQAFRNDIPGRRAGLALLEQTGARLLVAGALGNGALSVRFLVRRTRSPDYSVHAYFPETMAVPVLDADALWLTLGVRVACDAAKWSSLTGAFEAPVLQPWLEAAGKRLARGQAADPSLDPLRRVLADALMQLDGEQGVVRGAKEALPLYQALAQRENGGQEGGKDPFLQVNHGLCLMHLTRSGDRTLARKAVETLQAALKGLDPSTGPLPLARVNFSLGAAMEFLADAERSPKYLEDSTRYYRQALTTLTRERTPWLNAVGNKRLGGVLNGRFSNAMNVAMARQARDAFVNSLLVFTRQGDPQNFAWCQRGLGQAKSNIAAITGDPQQYEESALAYAEAASVVPRDKQARYFGSLQFRRGIALYTAAKRSSRNNRFDKALEAFDLAVAALDNRQDSWEWLRAQYHRGLILSDQGYRREDPQRLAQGGDAYQQGLDAYQRGLDAHALANDRVLLSWFNSRLGRNLTNRYELTGDASLLDRAQKAYTLSQSLAAKDKDPERWATLQHSLAWIAAEQAEASGNPGDMEHAAAMYRQAREARKDQTLDDNLVRQIAGEVAMLRAAAFKSGNRALLIQAEGLSRDLAARSVDSPLAVVRSGGKACLGIHLRVTGIKGNDAAMVAEGLRWLTDARRELAGGEDPTRFGYLSLGMARCEAWLAVAGRNPAAACAALEAVEAAWGSPKLNTGQNAKEIQAVLAECENVLGDVPPGDAGCLKARARTIAAIKAVNTP